MRAPGESLEVYAADVSRLVVEAFPDYGAVARREEKFRRFLAGMDPALRAKCLEQGATDLEEALTIAERCENAREALQRDCVSTYAGPHLAVGASSVQSVLVTDSLQRAVGKLTEEMSFMRREMKEVYQENQRLRERRFCSPPQGCCNCTCGEMGSQSRGSHDRQQGRSPDRGPRWHQGRDQPRDRNRESGQPPTSKPPGTRSPGPGWRARREEEPRRHGVHFLSPQQDVDASHQGNGQ